MVDEAGERAGGEDGGERGEQADAEQDAERAEQDAVAERVVAGVPLAVVGGEAVAGEEADTVGRGGEIAAGG
jgi:hypothetical protein